MFFYGKFNLSFKLHWQKLYNWLPRKLNLLFQWFVARCLIFICVFEGYVLLMLYWSLVRLGELRKLRKASLVADWWQDRAVSAHQFTIKGSSDVFYMCLGLFSPASRGHSRMIWICMKRPASGSFIFWLHFSKVLTRRKLNLWKAWFYEWKI